MNRFAYCQFADDIRYEVGGKTSLIGIYGSEIHVTEFPAVMPKFCAAAFFATSPEENLGSLQVTVLNGDSVVFEAAVPSDTLQQMVGDVLKNPTPEDPVSVITLGVHGIVSPLVLDRESVIKVIVKADGQEYMAGKLRVKKIQPQASTSLLP